MTVAKHNFPPVLWRQVCMENCRHIDDVLLVFLGLNFACPSQLSKGFDCDIGHFFVSCLGVWSTSFMVIHHPILDAATMERA